MVCDTDPQPTKGRQDSCRNRHRLRNPEARSSDQHHHRASLLLWTSVEDKDREDITVYRTKKVFCDENHEVQPGELETLFGYWFHGQNMAMSLQRLSYTFPMP